MHKISLALAYLACTGRGRRMHISSERLRSDALVESQKPLRLVDANPDSQSLADRHLQSWIRRSHGQARATGTLHLLRTLAVLLTISRPTSAFNPSMPLIRGITPELIQIFQPRPLQRILLGSRPLVLGVKTQISMSSKSVRVPGAMWPFAKGKLNRRWHRWIPEDDPTFEDYAFNKVTGYACRTPDTFLGTRKDGVYKGSCRVQFTLPGRDDEPKTLELMRSRTKDNPSFGAVKVKLPIDMALISKDSRLVVKSVRTGSTSDYSRIREGDIIRAISLPDTEDKQGDTPWWARIGQAPVPDSEEGMVILDGKSTGDFNAALQENLRVKGKEGTVVLVIERPVKFDFDDDDRGNLPVFNPSPMDPEFAKALVPIPVPVEDDGPLPPQGPPSRYPKPPR
mmetsp:Transcript_60106/g.105180  ORF Transcript_60106/g.105180 Transcript_60106/m.105180 type:complete len:397 (-) Transcript_60106:218-1408(-)